MRTALPCVCVVGVVAGVVSAEPPVAGGPEEAPALLGPSIRADTRPSIVEWRYDGTLRELETTPEEAAISLMEIDAETRARADAIFASRQAFFDGVLSRHLTVALEIDAAKKAEEKLTVARLTFELLAAFEPLRHEPVVAAQIEAILTPAEGELFRSMLCEYDDAFALDLRARAEREGRETNLVEVVATRTGTLFGRELERSFKRMEVSGQIAFEYVLGQLDLTREQADRARKAASPYLGANPDGMTEKEYGLAFLAMGAYLNEAQRMKLAEILAGF